MEKVPDLKNNKIMILPGLLHVKVALFNTFHDYFLQMITNNTLELAPNLEAIQGNPTIHHHQVQAISLDQMHLEHGNYVILGPSHHVTTGEPLSEVTNVTITSAPSAVKIEVRNFLK